MSILKDFIFIRRLFIKFTAAILTYVCNVVFNTCQVLSGYKPVADVTAVLRICPFSKLLIIISVLLSLVFIRLSKYTTISLDIFFFINVIILSLYQVFKDPQLQN